MDTDSPHEITGLLRQASQGDRKAWDLLMPFVYDELRSRAAAYMRHERSNHTLQPTALVHEAYLRLIDQKQVDWADRLHFYAVASTCIRRILVDHARREHAAKRSAELTRIPLDAVRTAVQESPQELLSLNEVMDRLAQIDSRKARVMELRIFGGLQNAEIANLLSLSEGTVERDLRLARAWLHRALSKGQ